MSLFGKKPEPPPDPHPEFWVVGRTHRVVPNGQVWELLGIWRDRDSAIDHCAHEHDFVAPVRLDEAMPIGAEWEGIYYPRLTTAAARRLK